MVKKKSPAILKPAKPHAAHAPLADIEGDARKLYYIQKVFVDDGPEAASKALSGLVREAPDPSDASMGAVSTIKVLDAMLLSWEGTQRGRSDGGKAAGLEKKKEAEADYKRIRGFATQMLEAGEDRADVVRQIQEEYGMTKTRIYRALRTHPSGFWVGRPVSRGKRT